MDVVICNFPPMLRYYLPAAPAVLLGASRWLGLESDFIDFNLDHELDIDSWTELILEKNPKLVAFSIFSYKSKSYAIELAKKVKEKNLNIKIVVGGAGTKDALNSDIHSDLKDLISAGVIDFCIQGDGEFAFTEFLTQFFNLPLLSKFNFSDTPYMSDYSSHNLSMYQYWAERENKKITVPVTGSRGCVRNCTYCDIPARWDFIQKSPKLVADEIGAILANFKIDNPVHIHFTDSLVNGNLKEFETLVKLLIELKSKYPAFTWGGQFIIRRAVQSTDEYWKQIGLSGATNLEIGIETGSDRLRTEMKKHFSNHDLKHSLELMKKYKVTCVFLMFTGMPTETQYDFNETLNLLTSLVPYNKLVITEIELGYLTTINPKTPLLEQSSSDPNMILTKNPIVWYNKNNPTLTFEERINRRKQFEAHAIDCGYNVAWDTHVQIKEAEESFNQNKSIIQLIEKQK